jgi:hypothetical protein
MSAQYAHGFSKKASAFTMPLHVELMFLKANASTQNYRLRPEACVQGDVHGPDIPGD